MTAARVFPAVLLLLALPAQLRAENRTIDGTGNHPIVPTRGAANQPMIRFGYRAEFMDGSGAMIDDAARANARDVSNAVFAQGASIKSARGLSDYIWAWGQFLAHDMDLVTTSNGPDENGTAPISINSAYDPLGPNPIPFTRSNWVMANSGRGTARTPVNEITSYIDASNVYGSDAVRAAALRTDGGAGAKLLTSAGNLLPFNTAGLPNQNNGPLPASALFLAGDIRANENSLLTSMHTIFAREHNRLVDIIAAQQPALTAEEQYQLARKVVGAEMQVITYKEFLPALLGNSISTPKAEGYAYSPNVDPSITNAFAHATYRFGHSAVSADLRLVDADGAVAGSIPLRGAFFNPTMISDDPQLVDRLLAGAATQRSEEIDAQMVDDLRTFLFGPPGAGGLDLAALNIQRGRDVGLPDYRELRAAHGLPFLSTFEQITPDEGLVQALGSVYAGNMNNIDAWVGALAETHVEGASVGGLIKSMLESQFRRLRDGDRLFYRSDAGGLYAGGSLRPEIAAIIDLEGLTLADVIRANSSVDQLQANVFFVPMAGDYNGDGIVDGGDYTVWQDTFGSNNVWADGDGNGAVGPEDYDIWKAAFGDVFVISTSLPSPGPFGGPVVGIPEPSTAALLLFATLFASRSAGTAAQRWSGRISPRRSE